MKRTILSALAAALVAVSGVFGGAVVGDEPETVAPTADAFYYHDGGGVTNGQLMAWCNQIGCT